MHSALDPAHLPLMLSPHIDQLRTRIKKLLSFLAGNVVCSRHS